MTEQKRPHITVEDHMGKNHSGTYVSHKPIGRDGNMSNVVLQRANGSRFRIVSTTLEVRLALGDNS